MGLRRSLAKLLAALSAAAGILVTPAADPPPPVAVVFNTQFTPESRVVAEHYAARRGLPPSHVIGLSLPRSESLSRAQYRAQFERPLLEQLESRGLITFHAQIVPAAEGKPGSVVRIPVAAQIRYVALCYGVPARILEATNLVEPPPPGKPASFMRNEAAVDTELAMLLVSDQNPRLPGPFANPFYKTIHFEQLHPTNKILMVTRLDGPDSTVARGLVDKAIEAETNGFWGRAYIDTRGLTNGPYALGDQWLRTAYNVARRQGFECLIDERPETLPVGLPMPQIALYAGWYAQSPTGPFVLPQVEFMPGAIAYHLYSFSASSLRSPTTWAGLLLAKGATATIGYVSEPFLDTTVDVGLWFSHLFNSGATLAEASYAAIPALSWQTTIVGDPLYRPVARPPQELHADLAQRQSRLLAWSHLRVVNLNLATGKPAPEMIAYLESVPETPTSALLEQKLGDLHASQGNLNNALEGYRRALALKPTPQQKIHLELGVARMLAILNQPAQALDAYDRLIADNPQHPDPVALFREALAVAQRSGDKRTNRYATELKLRTPASK